jgi:putative membrane protein
MTNRLSMNNLIGLKNLIIVINIIIILGIAAIFADHETSKTDVSKLNSGKVTSEGTKTKKLMSSDVAILSRASGTSSEADEFVEEFITEMAEARLMDLEEGKIAQQKSTTKELKSYGTLMVNDQTEMLQEIKKLAARKGVSLPSTLGPDKAEGLKTLREVHGKSFDKKFIKMMIVDHKRDVKKFERAAKSSDADVQVFATRYLPYVQSHLQRIRSLN